MPERNALPGTVVFVRDLGELFECFVDCGVGEHVIVAGSPRDWVPVQQGAEVAVRFPAEACVVVIVSDAGEAVRPDPRACSRSRWGCSWCSS